MKEMTDILVLDLVEKGLVTNSVTLWIAYDHRYGQEPSRGTAKFSEATNSSRRNLWEQIIINGMFTALCAALFWKKARRVIRRWIVKNVRAHGVYER